MDQFKIFDRVYLEAVGRGFVDDYAVMCPQGDHARYIEWLVNSGRFWIFLGSRDFVEALYEYFQEVDESKSEEEGYVPVIGEDEDMDAFHKRILNAPSPLSTILASAFITPPDLPAPIEVDE